MVPTSTSFAPARFMMSGIRNAPPISMSSPRETGTSRRLAKVSRTSSTAAALLLTTIAASAEVRPAQPRFDVPMPIPAPSGGHVEFEVARAAGHRGHRRDGGLRQRRASEVGVQHRPGEIEQGDERRRGQRADPDGDAGFERRTLDAAPGFERRAGLVECAPHRFEHQRPAVRAQEGGDHILREQPIHGGEVGEGRETRQGSKGRRVAGECAAAREAASY